MHSPETDRSGHRRTIRAGITGIVTIFSRGIAVLINLMTIPLTSHYLGKERFGLWLILSSFIAWVSIADLGLTNSLVNALSRADGKNDSDMAKESVASAFWMVTPIALVAITVIIFVSPLISWQDIFNLTSSQAIDEVTTAVVIVLIYCALRLPGSIISCIYHAYQEGYVHHFWNFLSGITGTFFLIIAIKLQAGLPVLAAATLGGMLIADIGSGVYLFFWRRKYLQPKLNGFKWDRAKTLLKNGFQFWVAQISAVAITHTNLIIISMLFGAADVSGYGTTLRLFAFVGAIQTAFVSPLWAAYGEALTRSDVTWIRHTFYRSIRFSLLWMLIVGIVVYMLLPVIFRLLLTDDIKADQGLGLAIFSTEVINAISRCFSTFLNGLGEIRLQAILGPLFGALNLGFSWWMGGKFGPQGVAWATAICLFIFWPVIMGRLAHSKLQEMKPL